ncbi:MAG: CRISPR-associated endonuclease Cas4g/Cas1g [Thermodesulfobacteriota bacterium]
MGHDEIPLHRESSPTSSGVGSLPPIPARMLNEFVYCPRLGYQMWVQAEFADSADTVEGRAKHKRVDKQSGPLPAAPEEGETIHARSVWLTSDSLGLTAKIDLVEGEGRRVTPVDYKRGKRPHVAAGAYEPERVQLCAQGLLLREHGFECPAGVLYFVASRERVRVEFDEPLVDRTLDAMQEFRQAAEKGELPPPLGDSPKCPRCSLVGICLPDEVGFLGHAGLEEPRPLVPALESGLPLYVQSPRAYVRKSGETLVIEEEKKQVAEARLGEISQLVLFGASGISTPALHECMRREIPVTFMSYGGWFIGHTVGVGTRNMENRANQYRASFDPASCLALARSLVAAKIANCRTMLRRNRKTSDGAAEEALAALRTDIGQAMRTASLASLLGIEGSAAARYFRCFPTMLTVNGDNAPIFDFMGRNRRPPRDPVNALLSFAYAMLTREWTVTLSAVGLDPYRGFYHQPRFGRPALALDLMEPFRPLVADSAVIMAVNNGEVKQEDFVYAAGSCAMKEAARRRFIACLDRRLEQEVTHPVFGYRISYRRVFEVQARLLARYLAGEITRYPNFLTR